MSGMRSFAPDPALEGLGDTPHVSIDRRADLAVHCIFWLLVVLYVVVFSAVSLRRYDAFLMHALDMGNMEQAVWNTFHGHPFHFTNMRQHLPIEAFGTDTRLTFHVEPILLLLSVLQVFYPGPQSLLIAQTLILASGAIAARFLVRRTLPGSRVAELAFPLAYLLFPALQAASLYEFHPVTLTAPLLLWALLFADQHRPWTFVVAALLAISCKEEIGLVVALLALWSVRRGIPYRFAITLAVLATAWSLLAVLVIVPAAQRAEHSSITASPYLTRYLDRDLTTPGHYTKVTVGTVVHYWIDHPGRLADVVLGPPKQGFVQRLLAPTGYLSLFSPLTLAISLPSFLLTILSVDQHMYGGLGHYAAEFVGILIAAAIMGLAQIALFGERMGWRRSYVISGGCAVLIVLSLANTYVNGFAPFCANFMWPTLTPHVQLGAKMLALIPSQASVSAQDTLDPHLSDRAAIYLFPDTKDAGYIALDVSASAIPSDPDQEHSIVLDLLRSRRWDVLFANDGYLLLHRRLVLAPVVPTLPATFYRFATPDNPQIEHRLRVTVAGASIELLGYSIRRTETVNLRIPDVILTSYWRAQRPIRRPMIILDYLTNVHGQINNTFADQAALAWHPMTAWTSGQIVAVSSLSMGIDATQPGFVQACLAVRATSTSLNLRQGRLPLTILSTPDHNTSYELHEDGVVLCLDHLPVVF